MQITQIEAIPITIPMKRLFKTYRETSATREYVIVKVYTDENIIGIAEASTMATWSEPQVASAYAIEQILAKELVGESSFDIHRILHKMDLAQDGFLYSKAAIEIALYDAMGKALGVPVYDLLGGRIRNKVLTSRSIGTGDHGVMVEWAAMLKEMGSHTMKVKVGFDPDHDVKAIELIRKEVGDEVNLKIDANQAYREPKRAIETIQRMEAHGIYLAEQPVLKHDLEGMARVSSHVRTPIVADESAQQIHDVPRIWTAAAADVLCIYLMSPGGITRAKQMVEMAEALGLPCLLGGMNELGLGTAANLHVAAALPNLCYPGDLHMPYLFEDDVLTEPIPYEDDRIEVPSGPGLGVELNPDKVEKYRVKAR